MNHHIPCLMTLRLQKFLSILNGLLETTIPIKFFKMFN